MGLFDLFRQHDMETDHVEANNLVGLQSETTWEQIPSQAPVKSFPELGESIWHSDDRWRWEPGIPFVTPGVVTGIISRDWVEVQALDGPHGGEHLIVPRYSLEHRHTEVKTNTKPQS